MVGRFDPAPTTEALAFVDALRHAPRARWLTPTSSAWERLASIAGEDAQVRANLVPDAWLAALALSHGCRLATADRGLPASSASTVRPGTPVTPPVVTLHQHGDSASAPAQDLVEPGGDPFGILGEAGVATGGHRGSDAEGRGERSRGTVT